MAYNLMYFFCCLQVDGPINLGGGGEACNRKFTVCHCAWGIRQVSP